MNRVSNYVLVAALLCSTMAKAQTDKTLDITVQVLDGRNGKPMTDQHVLVFTGLSADAVKTHAQHTGVTTDGWPTFPMVWEMWGCDGLD